MLVQPIPVRRSLDEPDQVFEVLVIRRGLISRIKHFFREQPTMIFHMAIQETQVPTLQVAIGRLIEPMQLLWIESISIRPVTIVVPSKGTRIDCPFGHVDESENPGGIDGLDVPPDVRWNETAGGTGEEVFVQ